MADAPEITLNELEEVLRSIGNAGSEPVSPHVNPARADDEDSIYCIKNGAYVRISEDRMSAWIYLNPPKPGEDHYSKNLIYQFITEYDIKKGFHSSNIAAIAKKHVYGREILIARGMEPVNGIDGYYEWEVDVEPRKKPEILPDGSVDYSAMSEVPCVNEGDVIAIYHRAVSAKSGYDVCGREIPAKPSKDLLPLKGRGVANDKDPDIYYATTNGRVEYRDKKIDIKNTYEVRGDVDLITGKVEFYGDIEISGNVESGVIIRASRNVVINGMVEAANIYAGGDVFIKGGITGGQRATITAKGNVCANFIEHTTVEAGGDVRANSYIGAIVNAGGKVIAEGKNGSIISGIARGLLGVDANTLGNDSETKTNIASGYTGEEYSRYLELFQKESELQKILSDTVEEMSAILKKRRLGGVEDEADDERLRKLNEKKDEYFDRLDAARAEKEALGQTIEKGKGSSVIVRSKAYRAVTVTIEGTPFKLENEIVFTEFKNEAGKITQSPAPSSKP